jgi:hypothetical protein
MAACGCEPDGEQGGQQAGGGDEEVDLLDTVEFKWCLASQQRGEYGDPKAPPA